MRLAGIANHRIVPVAIATLAAVAGVWAFLPIFPMPPGIFVKGLVFGSLAGINAIGIVLLWRTSKLVNLAQPSMGLVGGVLTGLLVVAGDWPFWLAAPTGLGFGALLGLAADRIVLRRLREAPRAVLLVATVAVAQIYGAIQTALPFAFGGTLPTYSIDLGFQWNLRPTVLFGPHILALAALPVALALSLWFLYRSRFGLAALALGQDSERAQSLGIPAAVVRSAVWAFAGFLSTISGILSIPVLGYGLGGRLSPTVLLLALAPAVFAGLRSLVGAAAASLALGVAYSGALWNTGDGPKSELIIAGAVIVAIAVQGRRLGRAETAARASSWESAATPRPLANALASTSGFKTVTTLFAIVMTFAVMFPPSFLGPGQDSLYVNTSAFALAALGVSVAWMFAGEVVLGHWGVAGLAGVLTLYLPGPWPVRCAIAMCAGAVATGVLGFLSRRRSSLSFAVIGLAAASAASVAATMTGDRIVGVDPEQVGPIAAAAAIVAAIVVTKLRGSRAGSRLVAARDDPDRAPWFGVDPLRARVGSLALSGALVALAGALHVSASRVGLGAGSFEPARSLELLAFAVIGGLGSPAGALLAVGAITASQFVLPAWGDLLASGLGVLVVVIFFPGGMGRIVTGVRDRVAQAFAPREPSVAPVSAAPPNPIENGSAAKAREPELARRRARP